MVGGEFAPWVCGGAPHVWVGRLEGHPARGLCEDEAEKGGRLCGVWETLAEEAAAQACGAAGVEAGQFVTMDVSAQLNSDDWLNCFL